MKKRLFICHNDDPGHDPKTAGEDRVPEEGFPGRGGRRSEHDLATCKGGMGQLSQKKALAMGIYPYDEQAEGGEGFALSLKFRTFLLSLAREL